MRLAAWLTRRQIRAVIACIEKQGFATGGATFAENLHQAYLALKQIEIDDPPSKHGPKCPEPECGHSLKGHRFNVVIGHTMCQVNGCQCGAAKRKQAAQERREPHDFEAPVEESEE